MGTAKFARSTEYQALLPIRGKILNVQKASVGDMLKNTECASIIQVVGAGSGRTFDLEAARYGRIILMADADSDGSHIRCLLATLFFKYMPELVRDGRVYTAVPPLHRIELTNPKKGMEKYVYTYSDDELHRRLADLKRKNVRWKEPPPALQGARRDGRRPAGGDHDGPAPPHAAPADDRRRRRGQPVFELLMGSDVAPRKEFIVQGAYEVDVEIARRVGRVKRTRSLKYRATDPDSGCVAITPSVGLWGASRPVEREPWPTRGSTTSSSDRAAPAVSSPRG